MIISLDTECTGLDLVHGAMPFLVTSCEQGGPIRFWEWDVNPLTRKPEIPDGDLTEIAELLDAADTIYLQNAKYDARALMTVGLSLPWGKLHDTLVMGHLLGTNHDHHLDKMVFEYLGVIIDPFEDAIKEVTQVCRAVVKRDYPSWRIAKEDMPELPSVKASSKRDEDKPWKNDMWLPRALAKELGKVSPFRLSSTSEKPNDKWLTACSRYANSDSEHTLYLGLEMERIIRERGLWEIYQHRLDLPRVACEMECYGVTAIGTYTDATIREYEEYSAEAGSALVAIAADYGHELQLAEGASINDNMRDFFYGAVIQECPRCGYTKRVKHWNGERADGGICPKCAKPSRKRPGMQHRLVTKESRNLALPVVHGKKSSGATLDKDAMEEYLTTVDGPAYDFIKLLTDKRKHDTDLSYMQSYRRFWVPVPGSPGYYRIHPSLNPCATAHLRWASNSPNLQNVGKQEDEWRVSVRNCFGPAPDREWWSMDFQNIELRIPAYESGEDAMVELFEKPNDPPYFGSYHLLNASIVYPDLFWPLAEKKEAFKKTYKSTQYQWAKNGGFALQYGCGEAKADRTFRVKGAYRKLKEKLPKVAALAQRYLERAERTGYVETLPDYTVDATRGYPILASRTEDNRVLSTTPFNYHVSGTACWAKNKALVRCSEQLAKWRREGFDGHISLEIHDEIIFDFPRGKGLEENRERAMVLKGLMEMSGDDIRIPTPVSVDYHDETWAKGVTV